MADSNHLFYQEFEALAVIGLMVVVPVIIASSGLVVLIRTCPHWWGPFEIKEVLDEGQESVIGDIESSELGRVSLLLGLFIGALLALTLVAFLFGRALRGRLVVLGGYHNYL